MNELIYGKVLEQSLVHIKCSVTIRWDNWRQICVWLGVDLFYLLPWSSQHLLWINVRKTWKQTVFIWKPTKVSASFRLLSCISLGLIFCGGFLTKLIHLESLRNFLLVQGRDSGCCFLCMFSLRRQNHSIFGR